MGMGDKISEVLNVLTVQNLAIGAASVQSAAFNAKTGRITLTASSACWVAVGKGAGVAAAVAGAGSFFLPANGTSYPISIEEGSKIAVIQDTASGYLSVTESL
jgi:hypothetical protein